MKFILTLLLSCITLSNIYSKPKNFFSRPKHATENYQKAMRIVAACQPETQEYLRKERSALRLKAASTYYGTTLSDSTTYGYNSTYGYDITPTLFQYTSYDEYLFGGSKNLYDKSDSWRYLPTWTYSDSVRNTFNGQHLLTQSIQDYIQFNYKQRTNIGYNSSNYKILHTDSFFSPSGNSNYTSLFTLNASNKPSTIKAYSDGLFEERIDITYTGTGYVNEITIYMDSTATLPVYKFDLTYDANNNLTEILELDYNAPNWIPSYRETSLYNASNKIVQFISASYISSIWVNESKDTLIYGSNKYPTLGISYTWDTTTNNWVNASKRLFTYNSSDQILTSKDSLWLSGSWVPNVNNYYYYESYIPTGTSELTKNTTFTCYPNPAQNTLHIYGLEQLPAESVATISDMQGRIIRKLSIASQLAEQIKIPLTDLSAGTYILTISGEGKSYSQQFEKK